MSFKKDVETTRGLEGAWRRGLKALEKIDRRRITPCSPRNLAGSVNLEQHLKPARPNDHLWDYAVAVRRGKREDSIHWIEVHPTSGSGRVEEVEKKARWLMAWLDRDAKNLRRGSGCFSLVWISSGRSPFHGGAPQLKRLAELGVNFAGEHYELK